LSRTSQRALLIFTRNPEPGKCKTRLAASIGDEAALDIYRFLLRHTAAIGGRIVVTASVDNISFSKPIPLGSVVTLRAQVTRAFNSSMEVYIEVTAENIPRGDKFNSHSAYFTFVAVDQTGSPIDVPALIPETEKEKELYDSALKRRELRLILAKRLKPKDAKDLRSFILSDDE